MNVPPDGQDVDSVSMPRADRGALATPLEGLHPDWLAHPGAGACTEIAGDRFSDRPPEALRVPAGPFAGSRHLAALARSSGQQRQAGFKSPQPPDPLILGARNSKQNIEAVVACRMRRWNEGTCSPKAAWQKAGWQKAANSRIMTRREARMPRASLAS